MSLATRFHKREDIGQDGGGAGRIVQHQGHAMKTSDRVLGRNVAGAPCRFVFCPRDADQSGAQAIGIGKGQDRFTEAFLELLVSNAFFDQAVGPVPD